MQSSIYCTTAALWIAITTQTTFTLHVHWYQTLLWFNIAQILNLLTSAIFFLAIFNKYLRVLKIWDLFHFPPPPEFSRNLKLKTCHLLHFMHWHVQKVSVSIQCFDWSKMAAEGFSVARIDEYVKPCEPAIHVLRSVVVSIEIYPISLAVILMKR